MLRLKPQWPPKPAQHSAKQRPASDAAIIEQLQAEMKSERGIDLCEEDLRNRADIGDHTIDRN